MQVTETALQKRIRESNEAFIRMTPNERIVAIAKDARLQILAAKYVPRTGVYCEMSIPGLTENSQADNNRELFEVIDEAPEKGCVVCARGALFLSACSQFNSFKVRDITDWNAVDLDGNPDLTDLHGASLKPVEERFFTPDQIGMIEIMFECSTWCPSGDTVDTKIAKACARYGGNYLTSGNRLLEICDNLIRNEGTFVVPDKYL